MMQDMSLIQILKVEINQILQNLRILSKRKKKYRKKKFKNKKNQNVVEINPKKIF